MLRSVFVLEHQHTFPLAVQLAFPRICGCFGGSGGGGSSDSTVETDVTFTTNAYDGGPGIGCSTVVRAGLGSRSAI